MVLRQANGAKWNGIIRWNGMTENQHREKESGAGTDKQANVFWECVSTRMTRILGILIILRR